MQEFPSSTTALPVYISSDAFPILGVDGDTYYVYMIAPDGMFSNVTASITTIYYLLPPPAPGSKFVALLVTVSPTYAQGVWTLVFSNTTSSIVAVAPFQWGGTIDALLTAAQNADSQSYRIQQTVQGNSTWDHTTGTVGITSTGESFQLADEAGVAVSDQSLAVRRINSTVG
jgi:hypothetical protein